MNELTPRQEQVARLLVRGLEDKQIAVVLNLSVPAVKDRVQQIFNKLGVRTRSAVAVKILR
jgi:DNA-binding NarL/FixJ family response regulator